MKWRSVSFLSDKASLNTAAISKDDVQKQLDQFDQQQERYTAHKLIKSFNPLRFNKNFSSRENEFRKEHKRRQQALLQEKLRERRKRKQLAEVAATVNGEAPVNILHRVFPFLYETKNLFNWLKSSNEIPNFLYIGTIILTNITHAFEFFII